ncbi:MAG: alkaline phosphatase D family protein [Polyangiales bacterium]|nr:alkaline phosphatase D family protein [Myxococcales bacterium]
MFPRLSPRWFALVALLAFAGCGGDDKPKPQGSDGGNVDASDGAARMCTHPFQTPLDGHSPTDVNASPEDGASEVMLTPSSIPLDAVVFPLEVQSGEMKPESFVAWTKVVGGDDPTLLVWREATSAGDILEVTRIVVSPADGGFAKQLVDNLAPNTVYHYAFFTTADDALVGRSPIGRVRTALAPGEKRTLRIGATTCVGSESLDDRPFLEPYPALSMMGAENLDFTVHLGDVSYNDGASSLADFRASWTHTFEQQGYRDLLPSTGFYATWDDHEVGDNWNDPMNMTPEVRVARARQAFDDFMATTRSTSDPIWGSYQWGDTVEVIVLDLRSERDQETAETDDAKFISPEQLAFLKSRLMESTAHFKLVMSSVNMTNLPESGGWDARFAYDDRWEGYPNQRKEILDFIVDNDIPNVWFLAGDIHMGFVGRVEPEGHPYAKMWEITVGPGASALNPLSALLNSDLIDVETVFPCNQFIFWHGRRQVATYLELDPEADTIRVTFVDGETDETLFDEVLRQEPGDAS